MQVLVNEPLHLRAAMDDLSEDVSVDPHCGAGSHISIGPL